VLAAYREMKATFQPGRLNAIVLLSDGSNKNAGGADRLADLVTQLRKLRDPRRPIMITAVAYGPKPDAKALRQIAQATGGRFFVSPTPQQMGTAFLDALIGQAACPGPIC
jgi:hypothetical protein